MNELEQQLVDLGSALEIPDAPDLVAAVRDRLPSRPVRRARRPTLRVRRRSVLLGIALAVLLAGTAAAIPSVRHAVERVFGINGAVVERVPVLPSTSGRTLHLGRRIPVSDARHAASFTALVPPSGVDAAYVANDVPGGRVSLTSGRLLVTEFRGTSRPFILKMIAVPRMPLCKYIVRYMRGMPTGTAACSISAPCTCSINRPFCRARQSRVSPGSPTPT